MRVEPVADLPAGLDADELAAAPGTSARRGKLRRRIAFLRAARELLLRDLGGFVYELHRTAHDVEHEAHRRLRETKLARLERVDAELHELEYRLDDVRRQVLVREPGVGGECPHCGELYASAAHYCSNCGNPLTESARRELAKAQAPVAEPAVVAPQPEAAAPVAVDQPTQEIPPLDPDHPSAEPDFRWPSREAATSGIDLRKPEATPATKRPRWARRTRREWRSRPRRRSARPAATSRPRRRSVRPRGDEPPAAPVGETGGDEPPAAPVGETREDDPAAAPVGETGEDEPTAATGGDEPPAATPVGETGGDEPPPAPVGETREDDPAAAPVGETGGDEPPATPAGESPAGRETRGDAPAPGAATPDEPPAAGGEPASGDSPQVRNGSAPDDSILRPVERRQ